MDIVNAPLQCIELDIYIEKKLKPILVLYLKWNSPVMCEPLNTYPQLNSEVFVCSCDRS